MKSYRRIREDLQRDGNIKRYLFFALGEILLVMLGILLAFQVENWNESRKEKKAEVQYYMNIKLQLKEDRNEISESIDYNQLHLSQFELAIQIIENNDRSKIDTLVKTSVNLTGVSDFHRKSNIFETLVNSGEIKLLENNRIKERLQQIEETYIYINRLESNHLELVFSYVASDIRRYIKLNSLEAKDPEMLYDFKFQNLFLFSVGLMQEKQEIYVRALNEIDEIIALIDKEISY